MQVYWQNLTEKDASGQEVPRFFYRRACRTEEYRTPTNPDIRLGCIAAATPGETYTDYLDRTPSLTTNNGVYKRVVISLNPTDWVLNKAWVGAVANKFLGITTLGRKKADYDNYVDKMVNQNSTGGRSYLVPFYCKKEKGKINHSLIGYANSNQMPQFLKLWLSNEPVVNDPDCTR